MLEIHLKDIFLIFTDDEIKEYLKKMGYQIHLKNVLTGSAYIDGNMVEFRDNVELALMPDYVDSEVNINNEIKTVFKKNLSSIIKKAILEL